MLQIMKKAPHAPLQSLEKVKYALIYSFIVTSGWFV